MKKLDAVTKMLDFIEGRIDEEHCGAVEQRHLDAISFKENAELPLGFFYPPRKEEQIANTVAYADSESMLHNELVKSFGSVLNSVRVKDDFPLHIRSNHGVVLMHSVTGGQYKLNEGENPWAAPLEYSLNEYRRRWENRPYDITGNELVRRVCDDYRYFADRFSEYPKCRRNIRLSHPDMQGPFSIAQSLFGEDFFYELYDNPEDVHWLLERITGAYIELFSLLDSLVNNYTRDREAVYIHGGIYPGRALLKNDTATAMISGEHYAEFCGPYDEKISRALGKVSIHYCGKSRPFHGRVINIPGLAGINLGNPEMQDMDSFLKDWNARKISTICWGMNNGPEFLWSSLGNRKVTGFTLCCDVENIERASELVKRYRETGLKALAA
ncbi:MAG: hypothetical protein LBP29_09365 [Treponema sp.]|nr:hypothetical protein [Treponema sp.]